MIEWILILTTFFSAAQDFETTDAVPLSNNPYAQCGTEKTDKIRWSYCIYRYENHSQNVIYHFHGLLGNERDWERNAEKIMLERWKQNGQKPPVIVSVSFGRSWFLAEKNSSSVSGLYELFSQKILPLIQNRFLGFTPAQNLLLGFSMGGLNASQLYFKMPFFFQKAALICGAMATISPYASDEEIRSYIDRTKAQSWRVLLALQLSRYYFPTENDWQKHSPLALAQTNLTPLSPPIYMSNGLADEFGFQEGNLAFVDIAHQLSAPIQSDFYAKGGHCDVDLVPIADFLAGS